MRTLRQQLALSSVALGASAAAALGGSVSLSLTNGNDGGMPFNTPAFTLTNTSADGVRLTSFSLTIGDTSFNFDEIYLNAEQFSGGDGTQAALLITGDRFQDNGGPDLFAYSFANFGAGVSFKGQWDIDKDDGTWDYDARTILFNNGEAPNAVASFAFSDGSSFDYVFADLPVQDSYTLAIPSAGTLPLLALGAASFTRRRVR
ncbi:MAG: hypothetical protein SFY96_10545 [Planctomycetota bacterium]|nr:hypothetical protein [Planctomycetota bacterium]